MTKQQETKRAELKDKLLAKAKNLSENEKLDHSVELKAFQERFPPESLRLLTPEKYCIGKGDHDNFCYQVLFSGVASVGNCSPERFGIYWDKETGKLILCQKLQEYRDSHEKTPIEEIVREQIFELLAKCIETHGKNRDVEKYINAQPLLKMLILYHYDKYFPVVTTKWLKKICKEFGLYEEFGLQKEASQIDMNLAVKEFSDKVLKEIGDDLGLTLTAVYSVFKEMGLVEYYEEAGQTDTNLSNIPENDEVGDWLEPCFWKISMSELTEKQRKLCEERSVIAVRSKLEFQGQLFKDSLRKGDLVYICYGSEVRKLVQIDDKPEKEIRGLKLRHYHVIEELLPSKDPVYSDSDTKVWTPNSDAIFVRVAVGDYSDFNAKILRPFFGTSVTDLKSKCGDRCVEAKYWCVLADPDEWGDKEGLLGMQDRKRQTYSLKNDEGNWRQRPNAFRQCREQDKVIGYACGEKKACALLSVSKVPYFDKIDELSENDEVEFVKEKSFANMIDIKELKKLGIFINNPFGLTLVPVDRRQYKECMRLAGVECTENEEKTSELTDKTNNCEGDQQLIDEALKDETLKEYVKHLRDKKQIVLTGAPGTGKTYLARMIAEKITGDSLGSSQLAAEHIGMCQFHPTFDYSDFVEGLRPYEKNGTLGFERKDGMFMAFCREALKQPNRNFVFVIDEINRGDLSKIFGELFFAIEKSYRGVAGLKTRYNNLMKDDHPFRNGFYVPNNVYIIGTMNDIDRGVESIDFAIRRRFGWIEVTPEERFTEIIGEANANSLFERIKNVMTALNDQIKDPNTTYGLGPAYCIGPSYFTSVNENDSSWDELWSRALEPLLREYLRGTSVVEEKIKTLHSTFVDARKNEGRATVENTDSVVESGRTQQ